MRTAARQTRMQMRMRKEKQSASVHVWDRRKMLCPPHLLGELQLLQAVQQPRGSVLCQKRWRSMARPASREAKIPKERVSSQMQQQTTACTRSRSCSRKAMHQS